MWRLKLGWWQNQKRESAKAVKSGRKKKRKRRTLLSRRVSSLSATFAALKSEALEEEGDEFGKKEQLKLSLSLSVSVSSHGLRTRARSNIHTHKKKSNEEEENAKNELARRKRRCVVVFGAEDSPPNGAAEIASDDATGKVRALARAVDELHRRLIDVRVRVEVVRAERREAASDDDETETRWEKRRRGRRGGGWVRAVFEERKLFVVRERGGVSMKRVGFELRRSRLRFVLTHRSCRVVM